jgi:hypothetical protein
MAIIQIVRDLKAKDFDNQHVWSEYYDFDELAELRSWGVQDRFISELLAIAEEGAAHPFYSVPEMAVLPDRMRIYIRCEFLSPTGRKFKGMIINPYPSVIGIFCNDEIELFNPTLLDFWNQSEETVRLTYRAGKEPIFPLKYKTKYIDTDGTLVEGTFGEPKA